MRGKSRLIFLREADKYYSIKSLLFNRLYKKSAKMYLLFLGRKETFWDNKKEPHYYCFYLTYEFQWEVFAFAFIYIS